MYTITKTVGKFDYWIQETTQKEIRWNGLRNNAKTFEEERLCRSYMLYHKLVDGECTFDEKIKLVKDAN